ncbi:MAG: KpsF/GutQ family sugar-phosphate isomerase [Planctomycetaceae bacterium]
MNAAHPQLIPISQFDQLREGRNIVRREAEALQRVAQQLDASFCAAVDLVLQCRGSVIVCGMGKAGLIGKKIAATLSSTGTRSHFLHPGEAVHGDLGCLHGDDLFLCLSNSGETEELNQMLPCVKKMGLAILAITSSEQNTLATFADVTICIGRHQEAGVCGLAPSTSTTAMLAVGDALALVVSQQKGFSPQQFAEFHPAGSLGRKLKRVTDIMRPRSAIRVAQQTATVRDALTSLACPGRRSGAMLVVDEDDCLVGLFTDSDLARLLEQRGNDPLDRPLSSVMTHEPLTIPMTATLADVLDLLSSRKVSEVPVVDEQYRPIGITDITDLIGWTPAEK